MRAPPGDYVLVLLSLSCVAGIYMLQEQSRLWYSGPPLLVLTLVDTADAAPQLAAARRYGGLFAGGICAHDEQAKIYNDENRDRDRYIIIVKECPPAVRPLTEWPCDTPLGVTIAESSMRMQWLPRCAAFHGLNATGRAPSAK